MTSSYHPIASSMPSHYSIHSPPTQVREGQNLHSDIQLDGLARRFPIKAFGNLILTNETFPNRSSGHYPNLGNLCLCQVRHRSNPRANKATGRFVITPAIDMNSTVLAIKFLRIHLALPSLIIKESHSSHNIGYVPTHRNLNAQDQTGY